MIRLTIDVERLVAKIRADLDREDSLRRRGVTLLRDRRKPRHSRLAPVVLRDRRRKD